ncbi:MAG: hypothetical protein MUC83_02135 [Pirellula sp.]|jgi:hypothetical protein|nr:hypothetical protein [Pirellula sp.]
MNAQNHREQSTFTFLMRLPVMVAGFLLLLPLVPLLLATYFAYAIVLQIVIWVCWSTRGINVLLVYSDSPNWHGYIEANIIPRLPSSTVAINWSDRRNWRRFSLPVMAARFFGGSREFNPMIVVFRPFHWAQTYRFWQPFKDYTHGKPEALHLLETKLFSDLSHAGIGKVN